MGQANDVEALLVDDSPGSLTKAAANATAPQWWASTP